MSEGLKQHFCENCGAQLPEDVRFCLQCGQPVGGTVAAPDPQKTALEEASPTLAANDPIQPSASPVKIIGVSALAGVAVMLLAGGGWWWWRHRSIPVQTTTPNVPEVSAPSAPPPQVADAPPVTTQSKPQDPEVEAAQDLAEMILWLGKQPWVIALKRSMPKGVTVSAHADLYDAEGWSDVQFREHHAPDSGFDPDVSPSLGIFRISRKDRTVQWLEPVSGEYVPLSEFIEFHGLKLKADTPATTGKTTVTGISGGDFERMPPAVPNHDEAVIVSDPANPGNQVARIIGPDEMSFALPLQLPPGSEEATISLRLLHPEGTKLIRFEDGTVPEGIRLRVRLINDIGNSVIRDTVVRPTGTWRKLEFTFYDPPSKVVAVSVEAIWMEGPVYVDDLRLVTP